MELLSFNLNYVITLPYLVLSLLLNCTIAALMNLTGLRRRRIGLKLAVEGSAVVVIAMILVLVVNLPYVSDVAEFLGSGRYWKAVGAALSINIFFLASAELAFQAVANRKLRKENLILLNSREPVKSNAKFKTRISVKSGESYGFLQIDRISHFISEDGLTFAVTDSKEKYVIDYTIEALEPLLDPKCFFRVTRGCIVSVNSIQSVSKYFNSRLLVTLKIPTDTELLVSRARVPKFLKWLNDE